MLRVYNTLSRQKEEFIPLKPKQVSMYVCGVTVYDFCHIGHARAYVVFDSIRRFLTYSGFAVKYIQNFTDIDDKILKRAVEKKMDPLKLSQDMIGEYFRDMDQLNILRADTYPKVTEHIPGIIKFIEGLIEKNIAYVVDGDVYYHIPAFDGYGKLSKRQQDEMMAGARVDVNIHKKHPMDFALWKGDAAGTTTWDSPWGKGRPGWHIECSTMSRELLGDTFDIHGGGQDLIFPHHENEIAQSEGLTGHPMANYWIHNGFVRVDEQKMSKSLGNFFTIREVLKTVNPMVLRLFFLMTHYRMPINYSDQELKEVGVAYQRLVHALSEPLDDKSSADEKQLESLRAEFKEGLDDDFNTAKGLSVVFQTVKLLNASHNRKVRDFLLEMLDVLGILISKPSEESIPAEIDQLASERVQAKTAKDWKKADELRDAIKAAGYVIEDAKDGYRLKKI